MSNDLYSEIVPCDFILPEDFSAWLDSFDQDELSLWKSFKSRPTDLRRFADVLRTKYPEGRLIPFAFIHDLSGHNNDGWPGIACFDLLDECRVRIYDFAEPKNSPWMNHSYATFNDWFLMAQDENRQYANELRELD